MKQVYLLCHISKQAHHQAVGRLKSEAEKEGLYVALMLQTREIHPGMGLRTIYELLQPEGIGRDAFVALGLREGFRLKALEKSIRTTYSVPSSRYGNLLAGKVFNGINQLWSSDLTYVYCLGRFYYLVLIMDVYSRRIIGYSIADHMRAENNFTALQRALFFRGLTHYHQGLIHHSDRGSQYISEIYTQTLEAYGILISMCAEVYENTHIERVHDTIKNQYLNRFPIGSEAELRRKVEQSVEAYNTQRPHRSLQGLPPAAYEQQLKTLPMEKRKKMEIYTVTRDSNQPSPNQLTLFN